MKSEEDIDVINGFYEEWLFVVPCEYYTEILRIVEHGQRFA